MRWYTSIIPTCGKLRQEDHGEFVIGLGYIANDKPVRAKINQKKEISNSHEMAPRGLRTQLGGRRPFCY